MRKLIAVIAITLFALPCFAKTYGPTKSTDHLWGIAVTTRPSKTVSVQQTMVAIWRINSKAFNNDNINSIKPGHYLQIPPLVKIKAISPYAAIREVNRQNTIWLKTPQKKVVGKKVSSKKTHKKYHVPVGKHTTQGGTISQLIKLQHKNQQTLAMLEQQIKASNQVMIVMQQKYHMQLAQLQNNNSTFKGQLQQTNEQMQNLKDQVQQFDLKIKQNYQYWLISLVAIAVLFLILIISISSCRHKKNKEEPKPEPEIKSATKEPETKEPEPKESESDTKDTETEYDFLGSEEGIPAKLDLAQTYIDMEDKEAAAKVLKEIIQKGNADQTKEAADLLRQIK